MKFADRTKMLLKRILPDRLAYTIAMKRAYDPLIGLLKPFAQGRLFIDIGANTGVYSYYLQRVASRVIAIEPVAEVSARLAARNPRVDVRTCALSAEVGTMELFVPHVGRRAVYTRASLMKEANPGYALTSRSVAVSRLDDLGVTGVGALKIDVEGHELDVLQGAVETLRRDRPALVVEIEERHHPGQSDEIISWIKGQGYTAHYFDAGGLFDLGHQSIADLQPEGNAKHAARKFTGRYVNNFLFKAA